MTRPPIDWAAYLAEFHASHPGITEGVLARCTSGDRTPYQWLTEGLVDATRLLDLGCGSGPAKPAGSDQWVGLDLSMGELERAVALGRTTVLRGDMTRLPIADRCVDVVTSSMAMMLVQPIDVALGEIRRVLRDHGELRLLVPTPTPRPLTMLDQITYLRLFWAARSTTKFPPTMMRGSARRTLESAGFTVHSDERMRFELPVQDAEGADRFINSWYLPSTSNARRNAARSKAASMAPFRIGIPLRRIVARRSP